MLLPLQEQNTLLLPRVHECVDPTRLDLVYLLVPFSRRPEQRKPAQHGGGSTVGRSREVPTSVPSEVPGGVFGGVVVTVYCTIGTDFCPAKCCARRVHGRNRRDVLLYNMYRHLSRPMYQERSWPESSWHSTVQYVPTIVPTNVPGEVVFGIVVTVSCTRSPWAVYGPPDGYLMSRPSVV